MLKPEKDKDEDSGKCPKGQVPKHKDGKCQKHASAPGLVGGVACGGSQAKQTKPGNGHFHEGGKRVDSNGSHNSSPWPELTCIFSI